MQQQIHHHHHHHQHHPQGISSSQTSPGGRSLSPLAPGATGAHQNQNDPSQYFFQPGPFHPQFAHRNMFDSTPNQYMPDMYSNNTKFPSSYLEPTNIGQQFYSNGSPVGGMNGAPSNNSTNGQQDSSKLLDGLNNFSMNSYPASQYQHLLVAN